MKNIYRFAFNYFFTKTSWVFFFSEVNVLEIFFMELFHFDSPGIRLILPSCINKGLSLRFIGVKRLPLVVNKL